MSLSPNDIRNYSFPNQMRGYDRDEVDSFKDQVAQALEAQKQETLKLQMELDSVKSQLAGLKQFEDTIKGAAIDARRNADTLMQNAKKEAELILSRAKEEAEKLVEQKTRQCSHLDNQVEKLDLAKKSYLNKLKQLIGSHFELLDEIASLEPPERPSVPQPQKQAPAQAASQTSSQPAPKTATAAAPAAASFDPPKPKPVNGIEVTDSSEMRETTRETIATQPSKDQGIKTEDANAADEIVPVAESGNGGETDDHDLTDSLRKVVKDEQASEEQQDLDEDEQPVEGNDHVYNGTQHEEEPPMEKNEADLPDEPGEQPEPSPQEAAEKGVIDPELAAALEQYQHMNPEAKAKAAGDPNSREPNAIGDAPRQGEVVETEASADEPPKDFVPVSEAPESESKEKDKDAPMDPNDLASTLDSVAKKFEEEMDRAEKPN